MLFTVKLWYHMEEITKVSGLFLKTTFYVGLQ